MLMTGFANGNKVTKKKSCKNTSRKYVLKKHSKILKVMQVLDAF